MCERTIKLSLDKARKMYGKSPEMDELRDEFLKNFEPLVKEYFMID